MFFHKTKIVRYIMNTVQPFLRYIAINSSFANHFYTKARDCRFLYVLKGTCTLHTEHTDFHLLPNSLVYYPCGISYYLESTSRDSDEVLEYITVNFDFTDKYSNIRHCLLPIKAELFDKTTLLPSNEEVDNPMFLTPFVVNNIPQIKEDLLRLANMFQKVNTYTEPLCSAILSTIIYSILYTSEKGNSSNSIVKNIKSYIETHYSEDITNDTLAQMFNYHPYYANTVFKQVTGDTIHRYLMKHRINRSQELLLSTDMSILQIALACGFKSQAHFSTYFKKLNHTTPQEFRKKFDLI